MTVELLGMATEVVAAHASNNAVDIAELPNHIKHIYHALAELSGHKPATEQRPEPVVPVKKSVQDDYIICLEDGKKLKMLKRHLMTHYGLTPDQYREKWGLDASYPMVAPNYAAARSQLAKKMGLGRKRAAK